MVHALVLSVEQLSDGNQELLGLVASPNVKIGENEPYCDRLKATSRRERERQSRKNVWGSAGLGNKSNLLFFPHSVLMQRLSYPTETV